jgi:hypothetical protein
MKETLFAVIIDPDGNSTAAGSSWTTAGDLGGAVLFDGWYRSRAPPDEIIQKLKARDPVPVFYLVQMVEPSRDGSLRDLWESAHGGR